MELVPDSRQRSRSKRFLGTTAYMLRYHCRMQGSEGGEAGTVFIFDSGDWGVHTTTESTTGGMIIGDVGDRQVAGSDFESVLTKALRLARKRPTRGSTHAQYYNNVEGTYRFLTVDVPNLF